MPYDAYGYWIDKPERIYEDKVVPTSFYGKWRSIEFEMIFKSEQDVDDFIKFCKKKRYTKFVTIKEDGSIEADYPNEVPFEVVVSFRSGAEAIVKNICAFLKDRAYVNESCGAHVHFDMRSYKKSTVEKYGKRLANCVPALKQILPKSRRSNEFCDQTINRLDGYDTRYAFVNLQAYNKHKTIEIRGHSGTLNAKKILNWIKICETIMLTGRAKTKIKTTDELIKYYDFGKKLKGFIKRRYNKLNAPSAEAILEAA